MESSDILMEYSYWFKEIGSNWNISLAYLSIKQIAGIQWVQTNYNGIEHDGIIMEYY